MAGDDDGLQDLSTRMSTAEKRVDAIKSTLNLIVPKIKKLSLKIDNRSLTDDTY